MARVCGYCGSKTKVEIIKNAKGKKEKIARCENCGTGVPVVESKSAKV